MSPRAACQLEQLGFTQVYDYVLGIADWKAAGRPTDETETSVQRVADATRPDVPTCAPGESLETVWSRTDTAGWDECLVIECDGLVVGRLRGEAWTKNRELLAGDVMESGPTTVRANGLLAPLVERMQKRDTKMVTVTTPQGHLIGVLIRQEAEQLLSGGTPEQIWADCDGCPGQWRLVENP